MHPMLRRVFALVAGLLVAVGVVGLVEGLSSRLYPLPPGIDYNDREAMTAAIAMLPTGAFVLVLVAWGMAALAGSWVAVRIGGHASLGYLIGFLLAAAGLANLAMIPHPAWMWVGAAIVIPLGTLAGVRLSSAPRQSA